MIGILVLVTLVLPVSSILLHRQTRETHNYYVLHHDPVHAPLADVAEILGLQIVEPVGKLEDFWLARTKNAIITNQRAENREDKGDDPVIERYRRMLHEPLFFQRRLGVPSAIKHISRQLSRNVVLRAPLSRPAGPPMNPGSATIRDPLFSKQWSIANNSSPIVWDKFGYTGQGIVVAVVDTDVRATHKDLAKNFASEYSYDFQPKEDSNDSTIIRYRHGTAAAGVIAAAKNELCGVGIAYNSQIASLRLLGAGHTSTNEAKALTHKSQNVSIYTSSYGPTDDGKTVGGPDYVVKHALLDGVNAGRNGKGSIYVFAAGNGGERGDECNFDSFVNSIYTIAIGAVEHNDNRAFYSESCTALMAVAYSGTAIVTVGADDDEACTEDFGWTSAAAPAAAAIFALALEARPDLTWRDMQYLCVETARVIGDEAYWDTLTSKRKYSEQFGFGVLDAYAFVAASKTWPLVNPQVWMQVQPVRFEGGFMDYKGVSLGGKRLTKAGVEQEIVITERIAKDHDFATIEHVEVRVWVRHQRRGDVEVTLWSPNYVVSKLGRRRLNDESNKPLMGWTFTTLKHWGESPVGKWMVEVKDQFEPGQSSPSAKRGALIGITVTFWGCARKSSSHKVYRMPPDDWDEFPPRRRRSSVE